ncbi:hypothetical protein I302_103540 [Kwoniella bestiolae CBS 10118]|uniref:Uncharacterized protein n=1 Tax=Kwoniella bestiolae CBS 10118 TaxID=1296100 RepID=A0A1B9G8Q9_9TREE|nr:hypothetical protein I302_02241 [Kwoniella bestiolae CBS 10118]OCF27399.1 hypothetical protein I302_02241 [Kwoniella bestiolae CBS 10118]
MSKAVPTKSPSRAQPVAPDSSLLIPVNAIRPTSIHFAPTVQVTIYQYVNTDNDQAHGIVSPVLSDHISTVPPLAPGPSILRLVTCNRKHYPVTQWPLTPNISINDTRTICSSDKISFDWPINVHCFIPNMNGPHCSLIGSGHLRRDDMTIYQPYEGELTIYNPEVSARREEQLKKDKEERRQRRRRRRHRRVKRWITAIEFVLQYQVLRIKDWGRRISIDF